MAQADQGRLDTLLAALQQRWGTTAVRTLRDMAASEVGIPAFSTGFPAIDRATGIGGIPRGHLTEIISSPTGGASTLIFKTIAQVHKRGELAAFLDLSQTFDPDYVIRCGVEPDKILVVRPQNIDEAFDMAADLVASGGLSLIICNLSLELGIGRVYNTGIRRLSSALDRSGCAFAGLLPPGSAEIGNANAALRLQVTRQRWLYRDRDVQGYRAQIRFLKNKFAPLHSPISVTIGFTHTVRGDGA